MRLNLYVNFSALISIFWGHKVRFWYHIGTMAVYQVQLITKIPKRPAFVWLPVSLDSLS